MIYAGNNAQQDDRLDVDITIWWLPDRLLATHKHTHTHRYLHIPRAFRTRHAYLVATANLITHVQKRLVQFSTISFDYTKYEASFLNFVIKDAQRNTKLKIIFF